MIHLMTLKICFGMKTFKIILSEITMPRAIVLGMKHHLLGFYQVRSIYGPGGRMVPPQRSLDLHAICGCIYMYAESIYKSSCLKPKGTEP